MWCSLLADGSWQTGSCMLGAGGYATATFRAPGQAPVIATNDAVAAQVVWEERDGLQQPVRATLRFGGRTFGFEATHNAAAAGVSLGIAWMHGTASEPDGPKPVKAWSTMEVIKIAPPREAQVPKRMNTGRVTVSSADRSADGRVGGGDRHGLGVRLDATPSLDVHGFTKTFFGARNSYSPMRPPWRP